jgi:hypothetical protein
LDLKKAKKVSIVDFCKQNGIGLKQDSREYYRLEDHDSCVISDRKNLFKWNSKDLGGDIFDFIKAYYDCSFKEAKQKLEDSDYEVHSFNTKVKKAPYQYQKENEVPVSVAKSYLVNERRIDTALVEDFLSKGLIKQDKKGNVLFLWKKDQEIVGCTEQGTRKFFHEGKQKDVTWKKIQENSKEYSGFNVTFGQPDKMYFFESEIDLMSYITQKPEKAENATFVSMNGLKVGNVLHGVTEHYNKFKSLPSETVLCVDNDKAGRTFIETEFKEKGIGREGIGISEVKVDVPLREGFDWNDNLTRGKEAFKRFKLEDVSKIVNFTHKLSLNTPVYEME